MRFRYMGIIVILSMISMFSYLLIAGRHYLHMFQLSSYYSGRFAKWQAKNISFAHFVFALVSAAAAVFSRFKKWAPAVVVIVAAVAVMLYKEPKQKKKMVYTARVKRQIAAFAVMYALLCAAVGVAFILEATKKVYFLFPVLYAVLAASSFAPCVWVIISGAVSLPIEKCVQRGYVKDAEKKLDGMNDLLVVGVTGSYGKTSSKYMIKAVLSEKYNTLMTPESYNTLMGVVKTVRGELSPLHEAFVVEMGAKHVGEIGEIARLVKPKYGLITTIGIQHLESFGSEENIVKAKFELVDALPPDGKAFLNYDCEKIKEHNKYGNTVSFGFSEGCDYRAEDIVCSDRGTDFTIAAKDGTKIPVSMKLLGRHNVANFLSAAAIGLETGVSAEEIRRAAAKLSPVPHRLELRDAGAYTVIDNAFNSNPKGAAESLYVLSRFEGYTKICVTPGFIELGARQSEESRKFGGELAKVCDAVILVGKSVTADIKSGIEEAGYAGTLLTADTLSDALGLIAGIEGEKKAVLFENDLPDNYEPQGK